MPIFILISVLAFSLNGFSTRLFQTRARDAARRLPLYQCVFCLFAFLLFATKGGFALPSPTTILYGIAFGVLFCLATAMGAKGYEMGSMALTSVIINMSLIIPMLYSILFEKEPIELLHVLGFALFVGSLILSALSTKSKEKSPTEKKKAGLSGGLLWFLVILVGFFSNGCTAMIQKNYALHAPEKQDAMFLAVAYLIAAGIFFFSYLPKRKLPYEGLPANRGLDAVLLLTLAVLAGLGSFGGNYLLGVLTTRIPGAILYPCINGGLALCTSLVSFTVFREKPTLPKLASLAVGCGAIIVLNLA